MLKLPLLKCAIGSGANPLSAKLAASIVCAIRPETIIVSKTNEKISDICIKGVISNTSFYGNMTYIYVNIEGLSKPIMVSTSDVLEGLSHNSDCYLNINLKDIRIIQKNWPVIISTTGQKYYFI